MTKTEWCDCDDAGLMIDFLWRRLGIGPTDLGVRFGGNAQESDAAPSEGLVGSLHRFYLASCRAIWPLLPQEESRRGVELAEAFLAGQATAQQLSSYNWQTEAAAFCIDYAAAPGDREAVARWVATIEALPPGELRSMLHPRATAEQVAPRELLKRAAYFADYAMMYPTFRPIGPPPVSYRPFLSATLLRQYVAYPGAV